MKQWCRYSEFDCSVFFSKYCRIVSKQPGHFFNSVDTELNDGNDCAKNHFGCFVVTTEMYRQFPFSFAFQISSFQSTGSTEYGVSTFTEVDHHALSDTIPFCIRLVRVSFRTILSVPGQRNDKGPCANLLAYSATVFGIRSTLFFVSFVSPYHVVGSHCISVIMFLDLGENLQWNESWEMFSTRTPSALRPIRSYSRFWDEFISQSILSFHAQTGLSLILPCTILIRRIHRLSLLTVELLGRSTKSSFSKNIDANRPRIFLGFLSDPWPTSLSHRQIVSLCWFLVERTFSK